MYTLAAQTLLYIYYFILNSSNNGTTGRVKNIWIWFAKPMHKSATRPRPRRAINFKNLLTTWPFGWCGIRAHPPARTKIDNAIELPNDACISSFAFMAIFRTTAVDIHSPWFCLHVQRLKCLQCHLLKLCFVLRLHSSSLSPSPAPLYGHCRKQKKMNKQLSYCACVHLVRTAFQFSISRP